ncbi:hypothetical protein U1Q18_025914, partial [Sarracenia purpurea var. burkii]
MSSQPPQASQAQGTPTVRPPLGVVGSSGTPVTQEQGIAAKTQGQTFAAPVVSTPAPTASPPTPPAGHAIAVQVPSSSAPSSAAAKGKSPASLSQPAVA